MLYREIYVVKNRETIDDVSVAIGFTAAYITSDTIYGGATAAPSTCHVWVKYRAVVSGGYLIPA